MYLSIFRRILPLVILFAISSCAPMPSLQTQPRMSGKRVKVGILRNTGIADIILNGSFDIKADKGRAFTYREGAYTVYASSRGISLNGIVSKAPIALKPYSEEGFITVNGKDYRGEIIVLINREGNLNIINELELEDYLCGVMKTEISPQWPVEALKAQAVVSRTYTLKNLGKFKEEGFDLTSTTDCQVYAGMAGESPQTNRAVQGTRGEVITYKGELIKAFFHANSGGYTEDVSRVWGMKGPALPYLKGRRSPYCRNSPHYEWSCTLSKKEIEGILRDAGYKVMGLRKIRISVKSRSGRGVQILLYHKGGRTEIQANRFRMLLGTGRIRSTLFQVRDKGEEIEFTGRGWGHGVGMSQWGAKNMAERGYSYKDIIKFYFPGTRLEKWDE